MKLSTFIRLSEGSRARGGLVKVLCSLAPGFSGASVFLARSARVILRLVCPGSVCPLWVKSRHRVTVRIMSVLFLKADIHKRGLHVRQVPEADVRTMSDEASELLPTFNPKARHGGVL